MGMNIEYRIPVASLDHSKKYLSSSMCGVQRRQHPNRSLHIGHFRTTIDMLFFFDVSSYIFLREYY